MNKTRMKRLMAMLLVLIQTFGLLGGCGGYGAAEGFAAEQTQPTDSSVLPAANDTAVTEYFEVKFALPPDASTQDVEYTTLPETVMVPAGTVIGALETPSRISSLFLGWNYDEAGTAPADTSDVIDRNLTLYPRFALKEGLEEGGSLSYISKTEVPLDYPIELMAYGLTQEEIEQLVTLQDGSLCVDDMPFTLISCLEADETAWLMGLGLDEAAAAQAWACVGAEKEQPESSLFAALSAIQQDGEPLSIDVIAAILARYAPYELIAGASEAEGLTDVDGEPFDPEISLPDTMEIDTSELDESTAAMLAAANIDLASASEEELKAQYGLAEDDSLQRFWREEVGLPVEQVLILEQLLLNRNESAGVRWLLLPEGGLWEGGSLYSASIADTSKLRFVFDDEVMDARIVEYNITVYQEEVVNISLSSDVIDLSADDVQGVDFASIINLQMDDDDELVAVENDGTGVLTYTGEQPLTVGDVIAVRDGQADSKGFTDGSVAYVKLTQALGDGQYAYEQAGVEDILFIADNIPVPDDGSLEDGVIRLPEASLDFSDPSFEQFGLDASTRLEPGDYITFYTGALEGADYAAAGYGLVTKAASEGGEVIVNYDVVSEEKVMGDELLLYMEMPEVDIVPTETEVAQLESDMRQKVMNSGLVDETSDFLTRLLMDGDIDFDGMEHGDEIRNMTIQTDDGEITLEELRRLSEGASSVEVSDVHVTFLMFITLEHFAGKKGLRAEFAVSFTIKIAIGDMGYLEIQPTVVLEQEFMLTPVIKVKRNKNDAGLTSSLDITASFQAGTYTGFGVAVTAKTKNNPDPRSEQEWEEMVNNFAADNSYGEGSQDKKDARQKAAKYLIKGGNQLIKKAKGNQGFGADYNTTTGDKKDGNDSKQGSVSPGIGGDLPTKYSNMLSNNAQYINFINQDLGTFDAPVDPMGIIHIGLKIRLTVGFKINCMIGAGISYENAKEFSYHFRAKIWGGGDEYKNKSLGSESGSSVKDIKTPNFRADFYAFGMLGVRAGVSIDLRVGVFSTDLDSVGVVATGGIYAELYGFLYCWFEWTSGQGTTSGAMGSLLFEIGIYTDISVKVQVGFGKASKSWSLYSTKTPLVQLGCVKYPIDFIIKPNDAKLDVDIPDGENTVKVPDELYYINLMALSSGKIDKENMDSKRVCETGAKTYTAQVITGGDEASGGIVLSTSRSWTQYNEDHFIVECFDLEGKDGKIKAGPSSFQYLPATNEIYVCPLDTTVDEVWGKVVFTYKNNAFGFSTQPLQREVKVHWKGTQKTASVEYYLQENSSFDVNVEGESYTWVQAGTGSVSGYDGIRCYVDVTPELCDKFAGYELVHMGFPDEDSLKEQYQQADAALEAAQKAMKAANNELWLARDSQSMSKAQKDAAQKKADEATSAYIRSETTYFYLTDLYITYKENNEAAILNRSGTTWFTMRGDNTVIRIYFKKLDTPTSWDIVDEDLGANSLFTLCSSEWDEDETASQGRAVHMGEQRVIAGQPVMDSMPEKLRDFRKDTHETKWYMYTYTNTSFSRNPGIMVSVAKDAALAAMRKGDYSQITELTPATLMPSGVYAVMIGVQRTRTFTVSWMNGESVYATTSVRYGDALTLPAGKPTREGYNFVRWETEDGEEVTAATRMPAHNLKVRAVFEGSSYTVTWIGDNGQRLTSQVPAESSLYDAIPSEFVRKCYLLDSLRTDKDDAATALPQDYAMPRENITVYVCYTVNPNQNVHSLSLHNAKAATCGEDGYTGDLTCDDCGTVFVKGEIIPATGEHSESGETISEVPSTCTTPGTLVYKCQVCGQNITKELPLDPENHTWGDTYETLAEPTCGEDGEAQYTCAECGATRTEAIPATGEHTYDLEHAVVTRVATCSIEGLQNATCTVCGHVGEISTGLDKDNHVELGDPYIISAPTCTATGAQIRYCKGCGLGFTESLPALGHAWGEPDWSWTGYTSAKATFTCANNSSHVSTVAATIEAKRTDATCEGDGSVLYTASASLEGNTYTDSLTETLPATGHAYGAPTYEWSDDYATVTAKRVCANNTSHEETETAITSSEVTKEPTYDEKGETTYTAEFKNAAFATQTKTVADINPLDEEWNAPTYEWADDYSSVTAKRVRLDGKKTETETVSATGSVTKAATCEAKGTTTYTSAAFENAAFEVQKKPVENIPALGHAYGAPKYEWSSDYATVTAKRVCANNTSHEETETANTSSRITKAATCEGKGTTTYTAAFDNAAFGTQTKAVQNIPALGHDYGVPKYEWSDDYATVTAKRVCANNTSHEETETANTSSEVTEAATCEGKGTTTYTATFDNAAFKTQTKAVQDIPALGHSWKEQGSRLATVSGFDGYYTVLLSAGEKKRVCEVCGAEESLGIMKLEPEAESLTLTLDELFFGESWTNVGECTLEDGKATVAVDEVKSDDGFNQKSYIVNAAFAWADDYSGITKAEMESKFNAEPAYEYTFNVKIQAKGERFSWTAEDEPAYYGRTGRIEVEAFEDDFIEGEAVLTVIGHAHDWVENGNYKDHTDTEDGYIEYECSICHKTEKDIVPAGHVWIVDDDTVKYPTATKGGSGESIELADQNGSTYAYHYGSAHYYCDYCDAEKDDKLLPSIWVDLVGEQAVTLAEAIDSGAVTLDDLSKYVWGLTNAQDEDGDIVRLVVPGSWSIDCDLPANQALEDLYSLVGFDFTWIDFKFTPSSSVFPEYEAQNLTNYIQLRNEKAQTFHDEYHTGDEIWEHQRTEAPYYEDGSWQRGKEIYACTICGKEKEEPGEQLTPLVRSDVEGIDSLSFPVNYLRRNSVETVANFVESAFRFIEIYYATDGDTNHQVLYKATTTLGKVDFADSASDELKNTWLYTLTESIEVPLVFTPYNTEGAFTSLEFTVTFTPGEALGTIAARGEIIDNTTEESTEEFDEEAAEKSDEEAAEESDEEAAEESDEEPADESDEESADESDEESADESDEESAEESDEEPAEESDEEAAEESDEEPADESDEEAADESDEEPADESDEEAAEESDEEPADESDEEAADESDEEPADESDEEAAEESDEEAAEESDEGDAEKSDEEPAEESDEEPTEKSDEEAAEESDEEPAEESDEEPAEESDEEPAEKSDEGAAEESDEEPAEKSDEEPAKRSDEEPAKKSDEEPAEELDKAPSAEPTAEPTTESTARQAPQVFSGSVRVELQNKGKICEGDNLEFKAIIDGNQALVSICWQKLVENEKTHEKEWTAAGNGEKFSVKATKANAAEKFRVALYDANGEVRAQTDVKFPGLAHVPGAAVRENEAAATCAAAGHYDAVVYCAVCGQELSRETKPIEKLAHTPGGAVRENEAAATCAAAGHYDAVVYCTVCGQELSRETKPIEKLAHTPGGAVRENEAAATCAAAGHYDAVVYCTVCGQELSRDTKPIEKLAHTPGGAVRENEVAATSEKEGSYDEVVYCDSCGAQLSRKEKRIAIVPDSES